MGGLTTSIWAICGVLLAASAGVIAFALRGRVVARGPHCRRCRFSLTGLASPAVCPECGADLTHPRSVLDRLRRVRLYAAAAGVTLALLAAAVGVAAVLSTTLAQTPTRLLLLMARFEPDRAGLADELQTRLLTPEQLTSLVPVALAVQVSPTIPWTAAWGDLLEQARAVGVVSDADWATYARQASPSIALSVPPQARAGDPIGVELAVGQARVGSTSTFTLRLRTNRLTVNGQDHPGVALQSNTGLTMFGASSSTTSIGLGNEPGETTVTAVFDYEILDRPGGPPVVSLSGSASDTVQVLPRTAIIHSLTPDPALEPALRAAVSVDRLEVDDAGNLYLQFAVRNSPANFAARVWLRLPEPLRATADGARPDLALEDDGRLIAVGGLVARGHSNGHAMFGMGIVRFDGFPGLALRAAGRADIILRADLDTLRRHVELTNAWDGEIVIRDVPVKAQGAP